jgi:hypothetical protein
MFALARLHSISLDAAEWINNKYWRLQQAQFWVFRNAIAKENLGLNLGLHQHVSSTRSGGTYTKNMSQSQKKCLQSWAPLKT